MPKQKEDKTIKELTDAGQTELLVNRVKDTTVKDLPKGFGEDRNPEVIRNRPNPDPHYGNPGPNPVHGLTEAQQKSVAAAAERSPDPDESQFDLTEEHEAEEEQIKDALESAGQETEAEKRQETGSKNRRQG